MNSIDRYLYPSGSEICGDSNGLLVSSTGSLWHKKLISPDKAARLPGGILIAEGGMGKTTFMENLRDLIQDRPVHLFKLGEYVGDPSAFSKDLEVFFSESGSCTPQTLLLDGLDEAPDLAGTVIRKIRLLPGSTSIWLASRDIAAIRAIQSAHAELISYNLTPLSEWDLRTLATQSSVDDEAFLLAAKRQGLLPICAKPLGCDLALSVFRENGLAGVSQRDLWQRGIERLCDETPSPTRQLLDTPKFTLDQVTLCSAWISLCLVLSDNHFVWTGEQSHRPAQSLGFSDLTSERFSGDLIRATLGRGVFCPLGDGRVTYSHTIYRDYLAAFGFTAFIPAGHWISLLMNGQRDAVFPQRAGIAPWLATYNTGFLAELSAVQPELLLSSADSVQAIGPDRLCELLLDRADGLSYWQRQNEVFLSNLNRLKDDRTLDILRTCLLDPEAGSAAIELATAVVEGCEYTELSGVLADRVLDVRLSLQERVDAAYAVCRLSNDEAKGQLKKLLPIDPAEDQKDDLRGTVLRACWPTHLTPDELVVHLIEPQQSNYIGAYNSFLNYNLPASLETSLDENSAVVLLNWAIPHINKDDPFDALGRLARCIYTICWAFAGSPAVANSLARGYAHSLSEYQSPFIRERYDGESMTSQVLSRETFLEDVDGRFAVLTIILSRGDVDIRELWRVTSNDYPLFTQNDLPSLFDRVNADSSGPLAEQWAICIKEVISRADLDAYASQVNHLHDVRPDLIDDSRKLRADMDEAAKRAKEMEQKWKKEEEGRNKEHCDNQERIDNKIKKALNTPDLKPESFASLSCWLSSQNGVRSISEIDIQLTPGWTKLTDKEQSVMLDLAQRYLTEAEIPPTAPSQHQYSVACALTALRLLRPSIYAGLSPNVWHKCGVELLKAAMHYNLEILAPLFDTLSEQFPDEATDAVLEVLSQELQGGFVSIIHNWGSRLSDAQSKAIMALANDPATDSAHHYLLLSDLARHGKEVLVRVHLDSVFSGGWNVPPDSKSHKLRHLAFVLSPANYFRQLLDSLAADSDWGRQWIESAIGGHDDALLDALLTTGVSDIAEMYIWLQNQYPRETYPEHEGVYSPGPLDEIHMLKNNIINHLAHAGRDGSTAALEMIVKRFPAESWMRNYVLDARMTEQANNSPVLSMAQVQELCEQRNAARCLVGSAQDLMDVIMSSLAAYGTSLQGDTPAVGDLWNTLDPVRPRGEEYLSNHLKRYLELRLTTDVFINREVQIRQKLYSKGAPGSRTDIWIQATDNGGKVLTLCIEVKCNWNKSAKTALKDQLIGKYMSGGTATAGILLLGWFACSSWDTNDRQLAASTAMWSDIAEARADLRDQVDSERKKGYNVNAIVLDCGLR